MAAAISGDVKIEMLKAFEYIKIGIEKQDPTVIGILVALVVGLITLLLLLIFLGRKSKKQGVILAGVCDAGKTLIFTQLVHKTYKESYTSIKTNSGSFETPKKRKTLRLFDLPGHERLSIQAFEEYGKQARGIVCVVDSTTYQKEIKDVAEYLYILLCEALSLKVLPFLILCNKQDLTFAKGAKVIKSTLEKEMNTLRTTRSAALEGIGNSRNNNNTFLGKRSKDFEFSDLHPLKIEFAECSALNKEENGTGLQTLWDWLEKIA